MSFTHFIFKIGIKMRKKGSHIKIAKGLPEIGMTATDLTWKSMQC